MCCSDAPLSQSGAVCAIQCRDLGRTRYEVSISGRRKKTARSFAFCTTAKKLGAVRSAPENVRYSRHDSHDSLLGQQLDEYRLEKLLGRGGMARVYRGLDTRLGRYVAIKVIDTSLRTDSEYALRFEREAQAIARLEHPNIVRLYRYGEAQGVLYMAMQYIEGADFGSVLQDLPGRWRVHRAGRSRAVSSGRYAARWITFTARA